MHSPAVDDILRLLFFIGAHARQGYLQQLYTFTAHHGHSHAAARRQLFGTFLLRHKV